MVTVELGHTEDADNVANLWVALAESQRAFGSHLRSADNRETARESIVQSAVADELLVARDDGDLVGFVTFTIESGTYDQDATRGIVQNLYVVEAARSEGIGSELLAEAERCLAASGAEAITLEVMADNDAARRFYRRHGYSHHRIELEKSVESDTLTKE